MTVPSMPRNWAAAVMMSPQQETSGRPRLVTTMTSPGPELATVPVPRWRPAGPAAASTASTVRAWPAILGRPHIGRMPVVAPVICRWSSASETAQVSRASSRPGKVMGTRAFSVGCDGCATVVQHDQNFALAASQPVMLEPPHPPGWGGSRYLPGTGSPGASPSRASKIHSCGFSCRVGVSKTNLRPLDKVFVTYLSNQPAHGLPEWVIAVRFWHQSIRTAAAVTTVAVLATAAACSSGGGSSSSSSSGGNFKVAPQKSGGSITVLESTGYSGLWPAGLDPVTDRDAIPNQDMMDAIFGQLFQLGPNGQVQPDLATSYSYSADVKDVTINLRQGVTFSDGTPFNAQAVLADWLRLLGPQGVKSGNAPFWLIPRTNPKIPTSPPTPTAIQATGPYTIVVHQLIPNGAFINQMMSSFPNCIGSPTAYHKMGETAFAKSPVGAGPFTVVSDAYSSQLVVKKNPTFWDKGKPYLDQITFKVVGSDNTAYEALISGQGQVYEGLGTPAIVKEAQQHLQVYDMPGTSPYDLQLNTAVPPFNNPKARQAIYAATNFA